MQNPRMYRVCARRAKVKRCTDDSVREDGVGVGVVVEVGVGVMPLSPAGRQRRVMQGNATMGPLELPLSLPIGGWPTPSIPPTGGGTEYGSNGPAARGTPWQRQLRTPHSPPFEFTSPQRVKRRSPGSFFKPAAVMSSGSSLGATPRPPATAQQLPEAPSTGSISYRPSEFLGATAPRRKPPRLKSGYPSPRCHVQTPPSTARPSQRLRPASPSRQQLEAAQHKLWADMRRFRQRKQRELDIQAYKFVFSMIDIDHNGEADPMELLVVLKATGHSATVERGFWRVFQDLDIDKSQSLSFNEFTQLLDRLRGFQEQVAAARRTKKSTAAAGDGDTDEEGGVDLASGTGATGPLPSLFVDKLIEDESSLASLNPSVTSEMANASAPGTDLSSRPSTTEPPGDGTIFMTEAVELKRQLLDVHCAMDDVRKASLRQLIVDPDEDSRARTAMGRTILDNQHRSPHIGPSADMSVQTSGFTDVADLAITATGGRSNLKGVKIEQQRRELKGAGGLTSKRKTQLAVRSTYAVNTKKMPENLSAFDVNDAAVFQAFVRMFDDKW